MNKETIIKNTISKFNDECSKITEVEFLDKIKKHEQIMIRVILETLLPDN